MIKKNTLLKSALSLVLFSPFSMATEYTPTPLIDTVLVTTDALMNCSTINDSTATTWNTGEICFASDITTSAINLSTANSQSKPIYTKGLKKLLRDSNSDGANCASAGGSNSASESLEGFCLASDLNSSIANSANFSVANEIPVVGMQFLQVVFKEGGVLNSSMPIGAECISSGGSTSTPENAEGFCLASDLSRSTAAFANLAVSNGLPVASLQFVQVLFADGGGAASNAGTECVSIGGSSATTGTTGGFCLAADLSTSAAGFANFSVAHDATVSDLQFLQVSFEDAGGSGRLFSSPGAGAPVGAECISVNGSVAAINDPNGFCLVSDLIESTVDSAGLTFANKLPVSGMQFLQVKFANGGEESSLSRTAECVSDDGSTAVAGNPGGFCLVSDMVNSTVESANFTVANDLPVMSWEFLQVPSKDAPPLVGSNNPLGVGIPKGVVISGFEEFPFIPTQDDSLDTETTPPPILDNNLVNQATFFHFSSQTNGIEPFSTPYWRAYPNIGLWVGR
ncbi:MAG: hypothetical protein L3J59_04455 [Methylococcaceae bacterium]|nr:hypothetical protein [Methylococcaceae bacterium]